MNSFARHLTTSVLALTFILLTFAACGDSEETREDVPTATAAGGASASAPPTATPVSEPPSTSQMSLDEYIGTVCGGQSQVGSWEEGDSLRELSEGLGFVIEGMGALEPPAEVAEWHGAQIAFAGAFKEAIDEYLDDPGDRTEDQFLLSTAFRLASHFEPVEQAIATMNPDVRTRMAEAGCIDGDTTAGGRVVTEFASISAGGNHTCGVGTDGYVGCWGDDWNGSAQPPDDEFSSVSAGEYHTCGVRTDGTVTCWGSDGDGEATAPEGEFTSVSAGPEHTCGVRTDGAVVCWGSDDDGKATPPSGTFSSVSAGDDHTCGVRTDGTLACWGDDFFDKSTPPDGEFISISAGFAHNCGIKADGSVLCWGQNLLGESSPPGGEFVSVSAGFQHHTCGLRTDGTVACWGDNGVGQATPPEGEFIAVDAGAYHSCGIRADASVVCWGNPAALPTTQASSPTPTLAPTPTPAPTSTPTPTYAPAGGFGNGTWQLGTDIDPGIYVSATPSADSFGCFWQRLSGLGGTSEDTIAVVFTYHRSIVEIPASDAAFNSEGCTDWVPLADAISPISSIPDGMWLVGEEVTPGRYVAPGGETCYWARLSDFRQELDSYKSNYFGSGRQVIEIETSDVGFETSDCGEWIRE